MGRVWTEIGLNTLYFAKLWERNSVVPSSNMGLMSSIRKSFFSCQMVDITLSDSCFFFFCHSNTMFVSVYSEAEPSYVRTSTFFGSHFRPCPSYCMQLFFSIYHSLILLGAYFEQTPDHSLSWSRDSFTSSSKLSLSPFPLFVFRHLNCWTCALFFWTMSLNSKEAISLSFQLSTFNYSTHNYTTTFINPFLLCLHWVLS